MAQIEFNKDQVVYSRYGAYIAFTWRDNNLFMQNMYAGLGNDEIAVCSLDVVNTSGNPIPFTIHMLSNYVRLDAEGGQIRICIIDEATTYVSCQGIGLRLNRQTVDRQFDNIYSPDGQRWEINAYDAKIKVGVRQLSGAIQVDAPWNRVSSDYIIVDLLPDEDGLGETEIHLYESSWKPDTNAVTRGFEEHVDEIQRSFDSWLDTTIQVPDAWQKGRELATYINWSAVVAPHGYYKRTAMLMSKNWMNKVWSWDNCFNALALVEQDPSLAWDQLMLFFDHQDENGAIPDHLTSASYSFRFYKPPVHGWTLRKLMQSSHGIDQEKLETIYQPLVRWTNWWLTYRDEDSDGLPQYHHGNESGWDNGTVFAEFVPVESPDAAAYLVIQMDVLAEVADKLGKLDEAKDWRKRSENLLTRLVDKLWNGKQFVARHAITHEPVKGDSSLVFMPLILGERLPKAMRDRLIEQLRRFQTANGIATEHPDSDYYEADGYWRGPIWAPSTYILVDGLLACGEKEFAYEISRKFCDMAQQYGMAENFDALSGEALRDRAYTWTASVFLLLGNILLNAES